MWKQLVLAWRRWSVARVVRKRGWRGVYVGAYDSPTPCWIYSVGFWECVGSPEVIVFDAPKLTANTTLLSVFDELRSGALRLEDGARWEDDWGGPAAVWRKVHPSQLDMKWLRLAQWYRAQTTGSDDLDAFQLVLPDNDGHLPWEEGYDERLRPLQPALYLPARVAADAAV